MQQAPRLAGHREMEMTIASPKAGGQRRKQARRVTAHPAPQSENKRAQMNATWHPHTIHGAWAGLPAEVTWIGAQAVPKPLRRERRKDPASTESHTASTRSRRKDLQDTRVALEPAWQSKLIWKKLHYITSCFLHRQSGSKE